MNLNEFESKTLLQNEGINVTPGNIAITANDAKRLADEIGYPVVLKIVSEDVIHKSDCGGVKLNVNQKDIKKEFLHMIHHVHEKLPNAKIEGIYVQKMSSPGIECIIGTKEDKQFGHIIMFGWGGIYAETVKDTSIRICPITEEDAQEMINETKVGKILNGARGKVYDIKGLINTIIKVSNIADKYKIKELDINPLIVTESSCCVVDARIKL